MVLSGSLSWSLSSSVSVSVSCFVYFGFGFGLCSKLSILHSSPFWLLDSPIFFPFFFPKTDLRSLKGDFFGGLVSSTVLPLFFLKVDSGSSKGETKCVFYPRVIIYLKENRKTRVKRKTNMKKMRWTRRVSSTGL